MLSRASNVNGGYGGNLNVEWYGRMKLSAECPFDCRGKLVVVVVVVVASILDSLWRLVVCGYGLLWRECFVRFFSGRVLLLVLDQFSIMFW